MKKRYLIGLLIVLMFSLSVVSASEDMSVSNSTLEIDEGYSLSDDVNDILADDSIPGEETNPQSEEEISEGTVNEENNDLGVIIDASDFEAEYGKDTYKFRLLTSKGEGIANATVNISYNGATYQVNTDDAGNASYNLGLNVGNWTIDITYENLTVTKNVKITKKAAPVVPKVSKVKTKNISTNYGTQAKYTVTVLDNSGKGIKGKTVTIKIGKNKYTTTTNAKGIATFTLNYNAGKYTIKYAVDKFSGSNKYVVSNKITLTILKWGLKGDVTKNKLIKKNMPNNDWVKKAVKATKKGIPLLKFEGGKGKTVFMTAGVHGNEISSQVAAMKMINHLTKTPIKGTIYIIPFVNVKAISKKVRHTGKDFNRVAAKSGTVSNNIVKLVVRYKCDAYGDFHTTKPGGAPGQNIVMGSKSPAKTCAKMTKYIYKNCKVNKRLYSYAGQEYPGALADNVNKHGIPGVICEVVLPHNTVTAKSVGISFNMMKHLLKFNSIL